MSQRRWHACRVAWCDPGLFLWLGRFARLIAGVQLALLFGGVDRHAGHCEITVVDSGGVAGRGLFQFTRAKEICHGVCHSPDDVLSWPLADRLRGRIAYGAWPWRVLRGLLLGLYGAWLCGRCDEPVVDGAGDVVYGARKTASRSGIV